MEYFDEYINVRLKPSQKEVLKQRKFISISILSSKASKRINQLNNIKKYAI